MTAARMPALALRLCLLIAVGPVLAGCYESHLARRDALSPWSGDAMAANRAILTIDPWPKAAWNKHLTHDGKRLAKAGDHYRDPPEPTFAEQNPELTQLPAQPQTGGQ